MTYIKLTIDDGEDVQVYQYSTGEISTRFDCPSCNGTDSAEMDSTGVWACDNCPASGTCDHSDRRVEVQTVDGLNINGHTEHETKICVCNWCDVTVEGASPYEDMHELMTQNQIGEIKHERATV